MELRRYLGRLGAVLVVAQLALFAKCSVSAQDCLLTAEEKFTPFRCDNDPPRLPSGTQAIITSYKFVCCGNITAWQTYVYPSGGMYQGAYSVNFQVWRPSPTLQENGCYSIVGENIFTSLSLRSGCLINETPEPSNIITVQPGDVVGYFMLSREGTQEGIQLDDSRNVDSVWYRTNTDYVAQDPDCPIPVGTEANRILISFTNAAPLLSVSVSSFPCLTTSTISPSSSSSLSASIISTTTSVLTQLSNNIRQSPLTPNPLPSHTSISPVLSVSISSSTESSPALTISSAALSTAVIASIAAVGGSALLITLLCTVVLAISRAKVQHKRKRTLDNMPYIVTNEQQVNILDK